MEIYGFPTSNYITEIFPKTSSFKMEVFLRTVYYNFWYHISGWNFIGKPNINQILKATFSLFLVTWKNTELFDKIAVNISITCYIWTE